MEKKKDTYLEPERTSRNFWNTYEERRLENLHLHDILKASGREISSNRLGRTWAGRDIKEINFG